MPYKETGYFSGLVSDYLAGRQELAPFFEFAPDREGMERAIATRTKYPVDRAMLADVLSRQYAALPERPEVAANIAALRNKNTFTICTAHQPNLLTGYLYFVYKILHAIKLAEELNAAHPDKHFVPVYYMGSEDNDLDELGTFRFRGDKYVWDGGGQTGAVGRMSTKSLKQLLPGVFRLFGPPGRDCDELEALLKRAYLEHNTIGSATQYLVHELFGRYGLVVVDPDDADLKRAFVPVMKDELLNSHAHGLVNDTIAQLPAGYKSQAYPRPVNLFYLADGLRERIERNGETWSVVNTEITWSKDQLLAELDAYPERFSPNVILRGAFQETILPDVAFIGGGAEVAYWLQLRRLFSHYGIFFPCVLLRQSVLWMNDADVRQMRRLELDIRSLFRDAKDLERDHVKTHATHDLTMGDEMQMISNAVETIKNKAKAIDPTLEEAAGAALKKIQYQLEIIEKKMLRAEKKKHEIQLQRIAELKKHLFPGGSLQERVENFTEYYLGYGPAFFDSIKDGIRPLGNEFLVVVNEKAG